MASGRSRRAAACAGLAVWLLLIGPHAGAAAQAEDPNPPDQVDPPADGEGQPLDDPSDPPPAAYTTAAQPSPSVNLRGNTWRPADVQLLRARNRFVAAARVARAGWPDRSRSVVLVNGKHFYPALSASTLAGVVDAPVLLTPRTRLHDAARNQLQRLRPQTVYVVGPMGASVIRGVERLGAQVVRVGREGRYVTSIAAARRAVELGANANTVVVVSGTNPLHSLAVPAFASGKQFPVLLAPPAARRARLERRVEELGARRVLVVGGRKAVPDTVVTNLPNVTRISGSTLLETAGALARRGYRSGMDGRPVIVGRGHWSEAFTAGAMAGGRRNAVVMSTRGRQLAPATVKWLSAHEPRRVTVVNGASSVARVARCQLETGRSRSWLCAERELRRQGYHMPHVDGRTDRFSVWAIYAFEKVAGLSANGTFGATEWRRMLRNPRMKVRRPDLPSSHLEINIAKQLILLVRKGKVRHAVHTSTGKSSTPTIRGTFTVYEKRPYRQANGMYKSIFFYRGYALHGYPSVPTYPASHGCARVYDGNQDWLYPKIPMGMRVATY